MGGIYTPSEGHTEKHELLEVSNNTRMQDSVYDVIRKRFGTKFRRSNSSRA